MRTYQPGPYQTCTTDAEVVAAIAHLRAPIPVSATTGAAVGWDIETSGFRSREDIWCLSQFSNGEANYLIPFKELTAKGKGAVLDFLADDGSRPQLLVWNAQFEWQFAKANGADIQGGLTDLMLMAECIQASTNYDHDLESNVAKYLKRALPKNQQTSYWAGPFLSYSKHMKDYAACDSECERPLYDVLNKLTSTYGLEEIVELNLACAIPYARMSYHGMGMDAEGMAALQKRKAEEAARLRPGVYQAMHDWRIKNGLPGYNEAQQVLALDPELDPLGGLVPGFDIDSPTELGRHLVRMGVPLEQTDDSLTKANPGIEKQAFKTAAKELKEHSDTYPFITQLLEYKTVSTEAEDAAKYLAAWSKKTGRMHPGFNINYCATGRSSSSRPNCQNMPRSKAFRGLIIPAPGNVLLICDFSQIELRVMAQITRDPVMLAAYNSTDKVLGDLHRRTAAVLNNIAPHEVTDEQRSKAKNIIFGVMYGMTGRSLKSYMFSNFNVRLTLEEAVIYHQRFMEQYVGVREYHAEIERKIQAGALQEIRSIGGHRRLLSGDDARLSLVANAAVQSCAATIMKEAAVNIQPVFDEFGISSAKLINIVHDEAVVEVSQEESETALQLLIETMELAEAKYITAVPAKAEGKIASSWAEK
jgi:DNA polymerase I-like protein with 3'-5' exonuclease and polymerase domains